MQSAYLNANAVASQVPRSEGTRALLVVPLFPVTYWGLQHGLRLIDKKATLPPLGLLTLAALLPAPWHLRLVDLNVEELDDADLRWADVVLTGGMLIQVASMHEIITRGHSFRLPVAIGGPAATTSPELFLDADVVFRGEAEGRIPDLVRALVERQGGHHVLEAPAEYPDAFRPPRATPPHEIPPYPLAHCVNSTWVTVISASVAC